MLRQRLLEAVPARLRACFDDLVKISHLAFTHQDRLPRAQVRAHDLAHHQASAAVLRREPLAHHEAQRIREPLPHLLLLFHGKHSDHAIHRLRRADRVQRGVNHVARLRRRQRDLHRLAVANFPDQNHLRRLSQSRAQADREVRKILAQFALAEGRLLVRMQKFDRVLERHHVDFVLLVDLVEHRRQRRRLAAARRPGHEDQPRFFLDHLAKNLRQPERVERRNLRAQLPHHDRVIAVVLENVHAKPREVRHRVARVARAVVFEVAHESFIPRHQFPRERLHMRRLERRPQALDLHRLQLPVFLHLRRPPDHEEQIGRPLIFSEHLRHDLIERKRPRSGGARHARDVWSHGRRRRRRRRSQSRHRDGVAG